MLVQILDKHAGGADNSSSSSDRESNGDEFQDLNDFSLSRVESETRPRSGSAPLSLPSKEESSRKLSLPTRPRKK